MNIGYPRSQCTFIIRTWSYEPLYLLPREISTNNIQWPLICSIYDSPFQSIIITQNLAFVLH